MNLRLLITLAVLLPLSILAQHQIGHTTLNFTDSTRSKNIPVEVYYPATTQGEDVPIVADSTPIVVVAHGFVIDVADYSYLWEDLVPKGYLVCLPNTETGISPNHGDFALDINFTATAIVQELNNSNSVLYGAIHQRTAYVGHSMGGGAVHLAAENNNNVHTLISLAAAETTPSAIAASSSISIPSLVFSGAEDCVAPSASNQYPMYSALSSNCKTYIEIIDGGHCNFANDNFLCSLGEQSCGNPATLDRATQQEITLNYMEQWLHQALKLNVTNIDLNGLMDDAQVTYESTCTALAVDDLEKLQINVYPNPAQDNITIESDVNALFSATVYDINGRLVLQTLVRTNESIPLNGLNKGVYHLQLQGQHTVITQQFIKQ